MEMPSAERGSAIHIVNVGDEDPVCMLCDQTIAGQVLVLTDWGPCCHHCVRTEIISHRTMLPAEVQAARPPIEDFDTVIDAMQEMQVAMQESIDAERVASSSSSSSSLSSSSPMPATPPPRRAECWEPEAEDDPGTPEKTETKKKKKKSKKGKK